MTTANEPFQQTETLVELRQIIKRFPGVIANDHVDLTIRAGEIHALLGENGAGKSTLVNILYGLYHQDGGEIVVRSQPVRIESPQQAMALGIGMVHQHFMLIPRFSIIENIVLGMKSDRPPLLKLNAAAERVEQLARDFGLEAPLDTKIERLTIGQEQKVEIIKALYRGARILILDEPTAVLIPQEAEELFNLIRQLQAQGVTIVFISHKLKEVLAISDRVTVMRQGRVVKTLITNQTTAAELAELMVGRTVQLKVAKEQAQPGEIQLSLENIYARDDLGARKLSGLSLNLRAGEIHGLAGVDGNGQRTLVEIIMGLRQPERGRLLFQGEEIAKLPTDERIQRGLTHIPEDRHVEGLVLPLTVADNLLLETFEQEPYSRRGWMRSGIIARHAQQLMQRFDIRAPGPKTVVRALSGGNQQKVILARALGHNPKLLIAMQPTRGLDVGAIAYIHSQIVAARDRGCAVLVISSELEEIMALSDVISVIYEGQIAETRPTAETDLIRIGFLMAGGNPADAPTPVGKLETIIVT